MKAAYYSSLSLLALVSLLCLAAPLFSSAKAGDPAPAKSAAAPLTSKQAREIKANLRQLSAAADQYYLETGTLKTTYAELVAPTKYVKQVKSVVGEDYAAVQFEYGKPLVVTTPKGEKVEYTE
jgi:hypothetical protein